MSFVPALWGISMKTLK